MNALMWGNGVYHYTKTLVITLFIPYLLSYGISMSTIAMAKSINLSLSVILSIPAGRFGDKYGSKKSILYANLFLFCSIFCLLKPTVYSIFLSEILGGCASAFYSGAYNAWLVSYSNEKNNIFAVYTENQKVFTLGMISAGITSSLLYYDGLYVALCSFIIIIGLFMMATDKNIVEEKVEISMFALIKYFKSIMNMMVISTILLLGVSEVIYHSWTLLFNQSKLEFVQEDIGIILSTSLILQFFVSYLFKKIELYKFAQVIPLCLFFCTLLSGLLVIGSDGFFIEKEYMMISYGFFTALYSMTLTLFSSVTCQYLSHSGFKRSLINLLYTSGRMTGSILFCMIAYFHIDQASHFWRLVPCCCLFILVILLLDKHSIVVRQKKIMMK